MPYRRELATYRWFTQAVITVYGLGGCLLGLAILIGGPTRFSASSFATAREVPGGLVTWGVMFLLCGAITLLGAALRRVPLLRAGLLAQAFGFTFLDIALIHTAFHEPRAALTGCVIYALVASTCLATWGAAEELT